MAGNIVHFEINAKDANRAKRFYSSLFGWKYKDSEMPGMEYYVIDGANPGGAINPNTQDPGPVVYFDTDNIDASIGKVRELGGKSDDRAGSRHASTQRATSSRFSRVTRASPWRRSNRPLARKS